MRSRTSWLSLPVEISPGLKLTGETLLMYAIAAGVVWYESRGLSFEREVKDFTRANLWILIPATLSSFLIWLLGENLIFARMFSFFHEPTAFLEVLPATAAEYFLQVVNVFAANGALVVFLHQRKHVPWVAAGFTMAFFGFLDGLLFAAMITLTGILVPGSPVSAYVKYSAPALALFLAIATWWLFRTPETRLERWLHDRPSLTAFRKATIPIYAELLLIRFCILAPQGVLLWVCFNAFHLGIPIIQVVAVSPAVLAASGTPITPSGLGPMQAVALTTFGKFAPSTTIMAASLSFSLLHLLYRLPLGLGAAHTFISRVLRTPTLKGAPQEAIGKNEGD